MEKGYSLARLSTQKDVLSDGFYNCFLRAFENYYVPMAVPFEFLVKLLERSRINWEDSVVALDSQQKCVGFVCMCLEDRQGALVAYNCSTGVVPEWRRKGLLQDMLNFVAEDQKKKGCARILLNVLEQNEPATKAYLKNGYQFLSKENNYRLHVGNLAALKKNSCVVKEMGKEDILKFGSDFEWVPAWDSTYSAIQAIQDPMDVFGVYEGTECVGFLVFYPTFLQILQLFVQPSHRNKGLALSLLHEIFRKYPHLSGCNYMGVPPNSSTALFLEHIGSECFIIQHLMVKDL
eukprot:TRINITY_DN4031_c0_g3_i1.p1 TRINITY_DN4031_c0_g3~~TRINITY_DN4031_c0_g3_i1.p1  ORF type:complete len:310 (+),score=77.03 TRINITY_DN4031_c0_g3_i1:60-932(+)